MKKITLITFMFILILCRNAYASNQVTVQIPNFEITVNDEFFDNYSAAYPFITYKDITYVPLTYSLCRKLGVITGWDAVKGLYISKYSEDYFQYAADLGGKFTKGTSYTASIPNFPVVLNGININSKTYKNSYPVLTFKNITYLPLTWEYVYYEFGWDIEWDAIKGLSINSNNDNINFYFSDVNDKYVLFRESHDIFDEVKNPDGSTTYVNTGKSQIKEYKLNLEDNSLIYEGLKNDNKYYENSDKKGIRCEDGTFYIENNSVMFNGKEVGNISDEEVKNPSLYADIWSVGDVNFYQVRVFLNNEIPAPYTPYKQFVYKEINGNIREVNGWNTNDFLKSVYEIGESYYLCSSGRHVTGRFGNNRCTVFKIDKASYNASDSRTAISGISINDKFEDYNSIEAIGEVDGKLVVKATWFAEEEIIDTKGKVSAINDGYFYLDENDNLEKIYPYVEGTAFIAPNKHLYLLSDKRIFVIDLTTGERIKLKK